MTPRALGDESRQAGGTKGEPEVQRHHHSLSIAHPGNPEIAGLFSLDCKQSACNAGDPHSIPGSGRSPEVENGNPLQHSCLDNSMDRGALWATDQGVAKGQTQLSD